MRGIQAFTYTFPEGSTGKKYQFTYYTTMPDGKGGITDVKNGVDVKKGEKTYPAEGTASNAVRTRNLLKNSSGNLETVTTGKMQEKKVEYCSPHGGIGGQEEFVHGNGYIPDTDH